MVHPIHEPKLKLENAIRHVKKCKMTSIKTLPKKYIHLLHFFFFLNFTQKHGIKIFVRKKIKGQCEAKGGFVRWCVMLCNNLVLTFMEYNKNWWWWWKWWDKIKKKSPPAKKNLYHHTTQVKKTNFTKYLHIIYLLSLSFSSSSLANRNGICNKKKKNWCWINKKRLTWRSAWNLFDREEKLK